MATTTETTTVTYEIAASKLDALAAVIARVSKKAQKLGLAPITYRVISERPAVILRHISNNEAVFIVVAVEEYNSDDHQGYDEVGATTLQTIEVTGEEPYLEGHRFLASIDHADTGNVVNLVPGSEVEGVVAAWREAAANCSHCNLQRDRLKTYLLLQEDGSIRQVGSTCIKDFFPGLAGDQIARLADLWTIIDLAASEGGYEYGGGSRFEGWLRDVVIAQACAVVREVGFVSRAKAEQWNKISTANAVTDALTWKKTSYQPVRPFPVSDADKSKADTVIAWVEALDLKADEDYLWNLYTAVSRPVTTWKLVGLVVSAVAAWDRENTRRIEREAEAQTMVPVPNDGKRITVQGKVLSVRQEEGFSYNSYVTKALVLVTNEAGESYKLWGNLPGAIENAQPGDIVKFAAKLQRSDKDEFFGFWSRPTKPEILATTVEGEEVTLDGTYRVEDKPGEFVTFTVKGRTIWFHKEDGTIQNHPVSGRYTDRWIALIGLAEKVSN